MQMQSQIKPEEVINFYKELKERVSQIEDPEERRKVIDEGLSKYSLSEWCEVGDILRRAKLI